MNIRKILQTLRRLIHPSANAPEGERRAAQAKLELFEQKLTIEPEVFRCHTNTNQRPMQTPRPAPGVRVNPKGNVRYGVRWSRREIRLWRAGDPRAREANYRMALSVLGASGEIGQGRKEQS